MTDTVERLAALEETRIHHECRLLILIDTFTSGNVAEGVRGLTKLAKLDFLLRYPTYLERALKARNRSTHSVNVRDFERLSVESRMVRYRFGPWDHKYPEVLRRLESRGLISLGKDGRAVIIRTTPFGSSLVAQLRATQRFEDVVTRALTLHTHMNLTGTNLMKFIYEIFPEVVSLRANKEIGV